MTTEERKPTCDYVFGDFEANEGDCIRATNKVDGNFYIGMLKYMSEDGKVVFHTAIDSKWNFVSSSYDDKYDFSDKDVWELSKANGSERGALMFRIDESDLYWDEECFRLFYKSDNYEEFGVGDVVNWYGTLYRIVEKLPKAYRCEVVLSGGYTEISYQKPCVLVKKRDDSDEESKFDIERLLKAEELMKMRGLPKELAKGYILGMDDAGDIIKRLLADTLSEEIEDKELLESIRIRLISKLFGKED